MTGIIIGRFQVPYLHPGHLHLIATALRECEAVIILLGTKEDHQPDDKNPYNIPDRVRMIQRIFPQVKIVIWMDKPGNDQQWCNELDYYLGLHVEPVLYHSRDSFKEVYTGRYPLREVEEVPNYSGTQIRKSSYETGN